MRRPRHVRVATRGHNEKGALAAPRHLPVRAFDVCEGCHLAMPKSKFARCFTCIFGVEASRSSAAARPVVEAWVAAGSPARGRALAAWLAADRRAHPVRARPTEAATTPDELVGEMFGQLVELRPEGSVSGVL